MCVLAGAAWIDSKGARWSQMAGVNLIICSIFSIKA